MGHLPSFCSALRSPSGSLLLPDEATPAFVYLASAGVLRGELYQHTYIVGWKPIAGSGASQFFQETTSLSLNLQTYSNILLQLVKAKNQKGGVAWEET